MTTQPPAFAHSPALRLSSLKSERSLQRIERRDRACST